MRIQRVMALALLAASLGGCAWFEETSKKIPWGWPFVRKPPEIPVTPQGKTRDTGYDEGWLLPGDEDVTEGPKVPPATQPVARAAPKPIEPRPTAPASPKPAKPTTTAPKDVKVVATSALQVNRTYISVEDVLQRARKRLRKLPPRISEENFRLKATEEISVTLRDMVTEALVMQEAERNLTDPLRKQIDAEVGETLQQMINETGGGSRKKLEHALIKDGTDLKTVMNLQRRKVTVQIYLHARFMPSITINRQMLLDYFQRHREKFAAEKKVQMQVIFAPTKSFLAEAAGTPSPQELQAARAQAKAMIDQAAQALMSGEDFQSVVKRLSRGPKARDGGVWPLMPAGSFRRKEVEEAAFAMDEGQVSLPIETETGFFIVKAKKVQPGKAARFEDAQKEIAGLLRQEQYVQLTEEYFKKLLARSTIGDSRKLAERAVDEAVARYWQQPPPPKTP